jgi:hypothetical protein
MNKNIFTVGDIVQVRGDKVGVIEAFIRSGKYDTILCQLRYSPKIVENVYLADIQHYNKDYTILSYGNSESLDKYEIKSVRRNYDGVVFTVGDKINFNNIGSATLEAIQFEVAPSDKGTGRLCFVAGQDRSTSLGKWWNISELKHVKKPLFTTEDSKDIFEGDKYWWVNINGDWKVWGPVVTGMMSSKTKGIPHFSTKEAAEEYIIMNKPCLSINDIIKTYEKNTNVRHISLIDWLRQLVKSKLEK